MKEKGREETGRGGVEGKGKGKDQGTDEKRLEEKGEG